jgi:UDP-N-acetylmuramoylalanine--D-glutamate ligase
MDLREHFTGKKITVMGLGLLGRGVGDTKFLAEQGAELIVTDLKSKEELASSLELLQEFSNITYVLGEHRLEDFRNRDFILKAAGVPLDSPHIQEAERAGVPVKMSASWFAELSGIPVVGVTGTRGKSTTTHMLHAIMQQAGMKVLLGGNVRGVSTLALLNEATPEHYALFELDSWQCQGFGDQKISPHVAVFTTFMADHMVYYKDDMEAYLRDKAQIFLHQNEKDTLVLGTQCEAIVRESYASKLVGQVINASDATLPENWDLRVPGTHNRYDAGLALAAARVLGISDESSKKALEMFVGVPGRLEFLREVAGVKIYNDTNATTPDATIAALSALPAGKTILIMGGFDKGLVMDELVSVAQARAKHIVLLAGTGTDRIKSAFPDAIVHPDLGGAVAEAVAKSQSGDVIVLSPAFASFGMFKNEYDRGDQFNALVNAL